MKAINIQYGPQGEEDVAHEIEKEVITFDDLEFHSHRNMPGGTQARLEFPHNKYGVSVVSGPYTYSGSGTYEVAITYDGDITYNTPLTEDVLGYQDKDDINEILSTISHYTDGQWDKDEDEIYVPEDDPYADCTDEELQDIFDDMQASSAIDEWKNDAGLEL